jgi:DNA-binding NtrC family response regulator
MNELSTGGVHIAVGAFMRPLPSIRRLIGSDESAANASKDAGGTRSSRARPQTSVLIVDDEPLICWSIGETLRDSGLIVAEAGSAKDAVLAVTDASRPVDVVLLDYQLPDSHDLGLLRTLHELAPRARIILMSAYLTPAVTDEARAIGVYLVIGKPVDMQHLLALVDEAAAGPAN